LMLFDILWLIEESPVECGWIEIMARGADAG